MDTTLSSHANVNEKKFMIADDLTIVKWGVMKLLKNHFFAENIRFVSDFHDLLNSNILTEYDVLITDLTFNGKLILNEFQKLKLTSPELKILVYTDVNDEHVLRKAKDLGANDVVRKGNTIRELIDTLKPLIVEKKHFEGAEGSFKDFEKDISSTDFPMLTQREFEVLDLLSKGYTTNSISDVLFISPHTVETYRKRLFSKFYVKNVGGLIGKAYQLGFLS